MPQIRCSMRTFLPVHNLYRTAGTLEREYTHGREGHTCSQEATGNLSSHSVALQAQIFKPCNCHVAIGAKLLRLLSNTCDCPKPVRELRAWKVRAHDVPLSSYPLRHIRLISAASSIYTLKAMSIFKQI